MQKLLEQIKKKRQINKNKKKKNNKTTICCLKEVHFKYKDKQIEIKWTGRDIP